MKLNGLHHTLRLSEVDYGMFHVDGEPIKPGLGQNLGDGGVADGQPPSQREATFSYLVTNGQTRLHSILLGVIVQRVIMRRMLASDSRQSIVSAGRIRKRGAPWDRFEWVICEVLRQGRNSTRESS